MKSRKSTAPKVDATAARRTTDDVLDTNTHKKQREDKRDDKLTEEMMYGKKAYKRTVKDTMAERDKKYARLYDFNARHEVTMAWDLNKQGIRDQIFMLKVGDNTVYLSAVQIQKYLRWV